MKIRFKCGCLFVHYHDDSGKEDASLKVCPSHEMVPNTYSFLGIEEVSLDRDGGHEERRHSERA